MLFLKHDLKKRLFKKNVELLVQLKITSADEQK